LWHRYTDKEYSDEEAIVSSCLRAYGDAMEEVAMIRGIKFVSVPVRDQDRALAFWTEKCGLKVATDQPFGSQRWIELLIPGAETGLVLFTMPGDEARIGTAQPMSLWCDDVFATAEAMVAKGVEFEKPPTKEHWGTSAIFKDPDGNKFVLSSR
jgi:catechol 2,3-dioxygenase-like lactoylglutathione lyase family enzyme